MKVSKKTKLDCITVSCGCGCKRQFYIYDYRYNGMNERNQFLQIGGVTGSVKEWKELFHNLLKRYRSE